MIFFSCTLLLNLISFSVECCLVYNPRLLCCYRLDGTVDNWAMSISHVHLDDCDFHEKIQFISDRAVLYYHGHGLHRREHEQRAGQLIVF
jgi:hypothetical protein